MKIWKYSGTLLTVTGVIHIIVAFILGKCIYFDILKNGLANSTNDDNFRNFAFWFLICGIIFILFGTTLQYYIKKEQKPAPLFLGYSMLIFTIVGCIINPISGFWLFLPQALIIIIANKKQ